MTRTSQLEAHYAIIQVDNLVREVVMSFQPTAEMLVAEVRERDPGDDGRRRLRELLARYRSGVLEVADTLVALRRQCGTDKHDLPDADDDDVRDELARLRAAREKADRAVCRPAWAYTFADPALATDDDKALDTLREGGAR
jgi:hypothetical protein